MVKYILWFLNSTRGTWMPYCIRQTKGFDAHKVLLRKQFGQGAFDFEGAA